MEEIEPGPKKLAALGVAILGAPVAWLLQLSTAWGFEEFFCRTGVGGRGAFLMIAALLTILALAISGVGYLGGTRLRRAAKDGEDPAARRDVFLGLVGILSSVLFGGLIVLTAVPLLLLDPCVS